MARLLASNAALSAPMAFIFTGEVTIPKISCSRRLSKAALPAPMASIFTGEVKFPGEMARLLASKVF